MRQYGDPDALDVLATRLARISDQVRSLRERLRAALADVDWRGVAAREFADALAGELADLDRKADTLASAAAVLRRHASIVRERMAAIAAAERLVTEWVARRVRAVDFSRSVAGPFVVPSGSTVPSGAAPASPGPALPPAGSLDWLGLAERLRRHGEPW